PDSQRRRVQRPGADAPPAARCDARTRAGGVQVVGQALLRGALAVNRSIGLCASLAVLGWLAPLHAAPGPTQSPRAEAADLLEQASDAISELRLDVDEQRLNQL